MPSPDPCRRLAFAEKRERRASLLPLARGAKRGFRAACDEPAERSWLASQDAVCKTAGMGVQCGQATLAPPPPPAPVKGEAARPPAVLFLESRCRGFTLVEVLVALTIVAVTLGAGLKAAGALTSTAQRLADVTAAQWCADNALVGLRLAKQFPGTGDADFACHQLGRDYAGRLLTRGTPNPSFRRVDAVVRDSQGHVLVTLSTVIGRY